MLMVLLMQEKILQIVKHNRPILISTMCPSKLNEGLGTLISLPNKFYGYNNLGIAYYVFNKKICHGCIKATSCQYYNVLVDIHANDSMVTYPILDENNNVLCMKFTF